VYDSNYPPLYIRLANNGSGGSNNSGGGGNNTTTTMSENDLRRANHEFSTLLQSSQRIMNPYDLLSCGSECREHALTLIREEHNQRMSRGGGGGGGGGGGNDVVHNNTSRVVVP